MTDSTKSLVRTMTPDDLGLVLCWRNHESVRQYMFNQQEIGLREHRQWYEKARRESGRHLLIFEVNDRPTGFINLCQSKKGGIADWGFYTDPDAPGGMGRNLGNCALDYAFKKLKCHKVSGRVLSYNQRSIRFHTKLGFEQEGVLREQYFDGVEYHHIYCFGLLSYEWASNVRLESP